MSEPSTGTEGTESQSTDPAQETAETDWKAEARKWEQRAKENTAKLRELEPKATEYDALVEASKSDLDKANEQLTRWQTEAQTWRKAAVGSRVEALAAQSFADPSDAVSALADSNFLDAGGQIDDAAIKRELDGLLQRKPHWAKPESGAPAPRRLPAPNGAQGSSGNPAPVDPAQQFASILQGQLGST